MSNLSLCATSMKDQITVGMASIQCRMQGMINTINALLSSCDNFDVYLNDYPRGFWIPEFDNEKITVYQMTDLGARGKFYAAYRTPGYYFTVDDDLNYPPDYIYTLTQAIEKYERQVVVGVHGTLFTEMHDTIQPRQRVLFSHAVHQAHDIPVHTLGTGVMAYHSDTMVVDYRTLEPGKIDDQVAWLGQEQRIPMMSVIHPDNWVSENKELIFRGSLRRNVEASETAVARANSKQWQLFLPDCWKKHERIP